MYKLIFAAVCSLHNVGCVNYLPGVAPLENMKDKSYHSREACRSETFALLHAHLDDTDHAGRPARIPVLCLSDEEREAPTKNTMLGA